MSFGDVLKGLLKGPITSIEASGQFMGDLINRPKDALGNHQDAMTGMLGDVGFNEENKLVKNSDAIAATIVGGMFAAPLLGGAGAGAGTGAGAGAGGAAGGAGAGAGSTALTTSAIPTAQGLGAAFASPAAQNAAAGMAYGGSGMGAASSAPWVGSAITAGGGVLGQALNQPVRKYGPGGQLGSPSQNSTALQALLSPITNR